MILVDDGATMAFGMAIAGHVERGDLITLSGDLGAGKTTLARGLLRGLGLQEEAPSPSFAILLPYQPPLLRLPVAHVDLYRIEDVGELEELGLEEARADGLLLVEWPEHAAGVPVLQDALALRLDIVDGGRRLTADVPAAWERRWPPR
ncbi:tRNA threonylcarbamoyladenosine biosynthesis protein TsaE [Sphingomonas jejuensis]|uniref:tRNA threonylcarbamoyladenosine biosynthesis protein TsaE n=1 Tax=Sphingomonas jejuensis TaxID=904715 RepID=A0ABX0XKV7_9SPHN|nr:tRNA (adenosine(37)-N6)-threonylcarbamoyltransferase complex ATPase subunit type 1 TsaE [Sphingomonas jejuensis]NJC33422.1 tRNA threonylcarbamoyladenosine biosynthesis protein TsaE [Sphingomonas jejuensis]